MTELNDLDLLSDGNLTGYYRFNSGALTTDSSGDGHTLTNENTVGETASGKYGYAADFGTSNTNKDFYIADNLGCTGGACSFAFWFKQSTEIDSDAHSRAFFMTDNSTTNTYFMARYYYNSGTRRIGFWRVKSGVAYEGITYDITIGTGWIHLAFTYDGSTLRIYTGGTDRANGSASGTGNAGPGNRFWIGKDESYYCYDGLIDDFCVFTDCLTSTEVGDLAEAGTAYSETYTDVVTIAEVISKSETRVLTDVPVIVDTVAKSTSRTLTAEIVNVVDSISNQGGKILSETVTIAESFIRSIGKSVTDVVTIVETIPKSISRSMSDVITIADTISNMPGKVLSEVITIAENITKSIERIVSDEITLIETFTKQITKTLTDTISISEVISKVLNFIYNLPRYIKAMATPKPTGFSNDKDKPGIGVARSVDKPERV